MDSGELKKEAEGDMKRGEERRGTKKGSSAESDRSQFGPRRRVGGRRLARDRTGVDVPGGRSEGFCILRKVAGDNGWLSFLIPSDTINRSTTKNGVKKRKERFYRTQR